MDKILARVLPAVSAKGETTPEAVTVTADWLKRMGEIPADAAIDPKKGGRRQIPEVMKR